MRNLLAPNSNLQLRTGDDWTEVVQNDKPTSSEMATVITQRMYGFTAGSRLV